MLKDNNINLKKTFSFPDHHNYSDQDYSNLIENDALLVTTEKDYSRIDEKMKKNFYSVDVDLEIENKDEFINLIKAKL